MRHREYFFKNVQQNGRQHSDIGGLQSEVFPKERESYNEQKQVDDQVDLRGGEGLKLRKDNCHTGYAAEGKVVWKFKNINANIHDQDSGSDQSILF